MWNSLLRGPPASGDSSYAEKRTQDPPFFAITIGVRLTTNMLAYIVDYLSNRKGTVKFQGSKSQVKDFDLGTPQGSCISPFLFNIIMNRLISKESDDTCTLEYPDGVQIVSYADDIVIMSN